MSLQRLEYVVQPVAVGDLRPGLLLDPLLPGRLLDLSPKPDLVDLPWLEDGLVDDLDDLVGVVHPGPDVVPYGIEGDGFVRDSSLNTTGDLPAISRFALES